MLAVGRLLNVFVRLCRSDSFVRSLNARQRWSLVMADALDGNTGQQLRAVSAASVSRSREDPRSRSQVNLHQTVYINEMWAIIRGLQKLIETRVS